VKRQAKPARSEVAAVGNLRIVKAQSGGPTSPVTYVVRGGTVSLSMAKAAPSSATSVRR
jgi:hypothetical protein